MKRLLRGIINFGGPQITEDGLASNFKRLRDSKIEWVQPVDEKIFTFVQNFFQTNLESPTAQTVIDYYRGASDIEAEERLKDIGAATVYVRKNYEHLLNELQEGQNRDKMRGLIKEADEILTRGLIIQKPGSKDKVQLKGIKDALFHFTQKAQEYLPKVYEAQTRGNLTEEAETEAAWEEYLDAEANQGSSYGSFTGLNNIDTVCRGCKRGELWIHAGFVGEMKTSLAMNWCYHLATRYRKNSFYVSMEMPYKHLRKLIYVLHSSSMKWKELGHKPLDYRKVRDGGLTAEEKAFYRLVLTDFNTNPEHCKLVVWAPDRDVTVDDIRMEAEIRHQDMDIGLLVLDHAALITPKLKNASYTVELNGVIRDVKKLALHFAGGIGVPTLLLCQINREGKDEADKNEGRYKIKSLAYSNEIERSGDYITTGYLNEAHRKNGTIVLDNLKNRDNPMFDTFTASVDFTCRRIFNYDNKFSTTPGMSTEESDDVLTRMGLSV